MPVHIIGTPPAATRVGIQPSRPSSSALESRHVVFLVSGSSWIDKFTKLPGVPATVVSITHVLENGKACIPITLPPIESVPVIKKLDFFNLPMTSMNEIGNIDAYQPIIESMTFLNCPSLVINDLSWFARMPNIKTVWISHCQLRSLDYLDDMPRPIDLNIPCDGIELSDNIRFIESYWRKHGAKSRNAGMIRISGDLIAGRKVQKSQSMTTASAIGYIRGWMAKRGLS